MGRWEAYSEHIEKHNKWGIVVNRTEDNDYTFVLHGWRLIASRLPIGEKEYKKIMKSMGGEIVSVFGQKQYGLLGTVDAEVGVTAFETKQQADNAIEQVLIPYLMIANLAGRANSPLNER